MLSRLRPWFTRRQLLQLAGLAGLGGILDALAPRMLRAARGRRRRFLSADQRRTLGAMVDRLIPADEDPGALDLGAVQYIDRLLSAFFDYDAGRARAPWIFAGGPFSGRHGGARSFRRFLRLSRVQEIAWRMRIEGSVGLEEREFNGPVRGYQEIYASGLAGVEAQSQASFGAAFAALEPEQRDTVLTLVDQDFVDLVYQHTVEAAYAPPEYGGNRGLRGWRYIRFEGDRQPVGYSRYDATRGRYVQFRRVPVSRADPGAKPVAAAQGTGEDGLPAGVMAPLGAARRAAALRLRIARGA